MCVFLDPCGRFGGRVGRSVLAGGVCVRGSHFDDFRALVAGDLHEADLEEFDLMDLPVVPVPITAVLVSDVGAFLDEETDAHLVDEPPLQQLVGACALIGVEVEPCLDVQALVVLDCADGLADHVKGRTFLVLPMDRDLGASVGVLGGEGVGERAGHDDVVVEVGVPRARVAGEDPAPFVRRRQRSFWLVVRKAPAAVLRFGCIVWFGWVGLLEGEREAERFELVFHGGLLRCLAGRSGCVRRPVGWVGRRRAH